MIPSDCVYAQCKNLDDRHPQQKQKQKQKCCHNRALKIFCPQTKHVDVCKCLIDFYFMSLSHMTIILSTALYNAF